MISKGTRAIFSDTDLSLKTRLEQANIKQNIEQQKDKIQEINENTRNTLRKFQKDQFAKSRNKALRSCLKNYNQDEKKALTKTINIYINKKDTKLKTQIDSCSEIYSLVNRIEEEQRNEKTILLIDPQDIKDSIEQGNPNKDQGRNEEILAIYQKSINNFLLHGETIAKEMRLSNNNDMMLFFTNIFNQINKIKNTIGNKDKGIIKSLGISCETQCSNKGGQCYQ
ncbi:MAG: hypothetical protein GXP45_00680 [bacterium]|nr:hypothetical protein [bacterium]